MFACCVIRERPIYKQPVRRTEGSLRRSISYKNLSQMLLTALLRYHVME